MEEEFSHRGYDALNGDVFTDIIAEKLQFSFKEYVAKNHPNEKSQFEKYESYSLEELKAAHAEALSLGKDVI